MAIKFVLVEIVLVETVLVGDPLYRENEKPLIESARKKLSPSYTALAYVCASEGFSFASLEQSHLQEFCITQFFPIREMGTSYRKLYHVFSLLM